MYGEYKLENKESYKGIYAMHKYWGKKPFNEISKFIEKYSENDDVILDCFCGSGVTIIEALKADRKAIGVDLNPIAIKLAKASITSVDEKEILLNFKNISKSVKDTINSLYDFEYEGENTHITHVIWKNDNPLEVWYKRDGDKKKYIRPGTEEDLKLANNPLVQALWYPTTKMYENTRINVGRNQRVCDLFTNRALVGLSLILDKINAIPNEKIRTVFELTLTGTLSQASKLVFVIRDRKKDDKSKISKAEVGSWVIGYWVPEEHFEINVWNCFENRFKRILKGVTEINSIFSAKKDIENKVMLINGSATELNIGNESVDYVFIDPPHTNRVLYMEQSLMWNAWLGLDSKIDWKKEIIVSEAKERKEKDLDDYNCLMNLTFSEIRRVLKKDKYFSFAFNSLDDKAWINLLNLFYKNGFIIHDIQPLEYSATSVIQDNRKNALKTDFVLTFKNEKKIQNGININTDVTELKIKIIEILKVNPDYEVYNVMNALFEQTIPRGSIYKVSDIIKTYSEIMD